MNRPVSDAEITGAVDHWAAHGWARLPAVATPATLTDLRARLDGFIAGTIPDPGLFFQADAESGRAEDVRREPGWRGPDVPYRKIEHLERDPAFLNWIRNPVFAAITARVHPDGAALYRAAVFAKVARTGTAIPWHQDAGRLWGLDREPCLQLWTALDDASVEGGCLWVVPGSHAWGLAVPNGGVVPVDQVVGRDADARAIAVPAAAGDVVLVHSLAWHRSGPNHTDAPRRALTVSLLDARTRCTRRRRAPRAFLPVFGATPRVR